jgi:hypothetical protein
MWSRILLRTGHGRVLALSASRREVHLGFVPGGGRTSYGYDLFI